MDFTHGGNVYKVARENQIELDKIVDFSANINPLGLSTLGNQRLKESWNGLLHYPDPEYVELKSALSKFHNCRKEHIFLGNGAIEAIFFLMASIRPESALLLAPTFVEYERALKIAKSNVGFYYLEESNDYKLDLESYMEVAKAYKCLVICNPNNPTGQLIKKADMKKIIEFSIDYGKILILDEAFMDFTDDDESHSCIDLIPTHPDLFVLRSITKFFAVPGLRLGYVLTSNQAFSKVYNCEKAPWAINHFAQEYTIGALEDEAYIKASKAYIQKERKYLLDQLQALKGIKAYPTMGNYIFLKYTGTKDLKKTLEQKGILIRSCSNYRGLDEGDFRVAVKAHDDNELLLKTFKEIL